MTEIRGLLFDKDGTLFDFQATWGGWASDLVLELADGDASVADRLADRIRLDRAARRFFPDSVVVAGTAGDAVDALHPALPNVSRAALIDRLLRRSLALEPVQAAPLDALLVRLAGAGYALGVATNDAQSVAVAQLQGLGILQHFDLVIGADSGHGAKPGPGQCLAFSAAIGIPPRQVAMIGDSTHDLHAGTAAGMTAVAVLTGTATREELQPHAHTVLPDIGQLPGWLGLG